ncbi:MAG: putative DNA binding domain-containing protein [Ignavibacteriae bacterium]|nr:putative DNA binding domain-containing protein [Ignavibacteriota bacterium]
MIETREITDLQRDKILFSSENHFNDLKSKEIAPSKLTRTLSAFANSVGGELYIGIRESDEGEIQNRTWNGFVDEEEANGHIQVFEELFPLGDQYSYMFLSHPNENGLVLHISVKKNVAIVKASNNKVYKRRSAQNLPIETNEALRRLELDKGIASFEDNTINVPIDFVTDSLCIYEFMVEVIPTSEPEPWLRKQLLIRNDLPTVASVMLYSDTPQAALPKQSGIKIYRYKTKSEEGSRETLAFDPISVEGPAYKQIYEAVDKTKDIIETGKVLKETGLENLEYPEKALHEIITNAVLHRDYSIASDIHVRVFDNRVEILSPGSLPGHITVNNILEEQFARNGNMVRLINKFPNPPNKDVGEGLNTAFEEISELRLKKPEIIELDHAVLVIIKHEPLASPEEIIMKYLEEKEEIHNSTARELTGIKSADIIKTHFYRLKDKGLIEMNPDPNKKGRNSTWIKKK